MAYLALLGVIIVTGAGWATLAALAVPVLFPAMQLVQHAPLGPRMVEALERTARGQLVFGGLLATGLVIDRFVG